MKDFMVRQFNLSRPGGRPPVPHSRYGYYTVLLLLNRQYMQSGNLFVFGPQQPFSWQVIPAAPAAVLLCFSKAFISSKMQLSLNALPVFSGKHSNSFRLEGSAEQEAVSIMLNMQQEACTAYRYKKELIQNYLMQLFHVIMKQVQKELRV